MYSNLVSRHDHISPLSHVLRKKKLHLTFIDITGALDSLCILKCSFFFFFLENDFHITSYINIRTNVSKRFHHNISHIQIWSMWYKYWTCSWYVFQERAAASMWHQYQTLTSALSQQLCEQLRLILEPTQAAKLKSVPPHSTTPWQLLWKAGSSNEIFIIVASFVLILSRVMKLGSSHCISVLMLYI